MVIQPYISILCFCLLKSCISNFSLRLPSAIFGVINVLVFYLICRNIFSQKYKRYQSFLSFLTALIFLTLRWYFNFVRFSFEMPFLLFLELTSIFFLLEYFSHQQTKSLIWSGLFAGFAFNCYQPGRIFFLVPLLALFLKKVSRKQLIMFLIPLIITITPVTIYLIKNNPDDIRFHKQFFLKNTELSIQKKLEFLGENISKTALMFNVKSDINARHNYPGKAILNPILGFFFLTGLIITIINIRDFYSQFFLFYFFISLLPTNVTYPWENPNMLRTFTAIPSLIFFIIQSLYFSISLIKKNNKLRLMMLFIFIIIFSISSIYEIRTYFKYQVISFPQAFEMRTDLKQFVKNKDFMEFE